MALGFFICLATIVVTVVLVASQFTNDGGANRQYSKEERAAKRKEIFRQTLDDRLCFRLYRLDNVLFAKLHNILLQKVSESECLPLFMQLAIFLDYIAWAPSFDRQRTTFKLSGELITKARSQVRSAIMKDVYPQFVKEPDQKGLKEDDLPEKDWRKFRRFAKCVGCIDGCHIKISADAETNKLFFCSRKKLVSTNAQFISSVNKNLMFTYAYVGVEGRASDSQSIKLAEFASELSRIFGPTLRGTFLIGDAGYAGTFLMLTPYRGVLYHLREIGLKNNNCASGNAVSNMYELFNLRHAMFRNQVERAFGVMKKRFKILVTGIEGLNLSETWDTIYCCVAIHNFIRSHISDVNTNCDIQRYSERLDEKTVNEEILRELDLNADRQAKDLQDESPLASGLQSPQPPQLTNNNATFANASVWRDTIARQMWDDYQQELNPQQQQQQQQQQKKKKKKTNTSPSRS